MTSADRDDDDLFFATDAAEDRIVTFYLADDGGDTSGGSFTTNELLDAIPEEDLKFYVNSVPKRLGEFVNRAFTNQL